MKKENILNEITGETLNRIDGLVSQPLLRKFLETFGEIYEDMLENGDPFYVDDVIYYLNDQMRGYAIDTKMDVEMDMFEEKIIKEHFDRFMFKNYK